MTLTHAMTQALVAARNGTLRARNGRIVAENERGHRVRVTWPSVQALERRGLVNREPDPDPGWGWRWTMTSTGDIELRKALTR